MDMQGSVAYEKSIEFSLLVINSFRVLKAHHEYILSKQLLRSATSIGANIAEAMSAYSRKEFLCKLEIALKEAHETNYWIILLQRSQLVSLDYSKYSRVVNDLIKILSKSTKTTKENLSTNK